MRIAISHTDGMVGGPGESQSVDIYETEPEPVMLERYENPAITATTARGIRMVVSALERNAGAVIVSGAGAHLFDYAKGRIPVYMGSGMTVESAVKSFISGKLSRLTAATHEHSHDH